MRDDGLKSKNKTEQIHLLSLFPISDALPPIDYVGIVENNFMMLYLGKDTPMWVPLDTCGVPMSKIGICARKN